MMDEEMKKRLAKLVNRPELMQPEDFVQSESDIGENFKVESPDDEFELDSEIPEMTEALVAKSNKNMEELPNKQFKLDPAVQDLIRKLSNGESIEDADVQPETIDDPTAPMELRKAAMEKVKRKYLGR